MDTNIFLVGLNHRTAGVDIRERFALATQCSPENWAIPCSERLQECTILSTCNRVEILACGKEEAEEEILAAWARARNADLELLRSYTYRYRNADAIRHLFRVAASLDSMVVGEPQILGQLKKAYKAAVSAKKTGPILNRLLHKAFSVAKRVRTETAVASNAVSISYAAVELAKRIFADLSHHRAMLIGAGEMAELAARHLLHFGLRDLFVANRTFSRAEALAAEFGAKPLAFDDIFTYLPSVDIIITSTGSTEPIIRAKNITAVLRERKNTPMFFIDIAVPRDVDPDVNGIDNVYLYDIDDLKEIVEDNLSSRRDEAQKAAAIVEEEVVFFEKWQKSLAIQPTIVDLIARHEELALAELAHSLRHLNLDAATEEALKVMVTSLSHKLTHAPLMYLKGETTRKSQLERIETIRKVFALER